MARICGTGAFGMRSSLLAQVWESTHKPCGGVHDLLASLEVVPSASKSLSAHAVQQLSKLLSKVAVL